MKIIAFSLWGSAPLYWVGARRNIELARQFYPGWLCRFYVEEGACLELVEPLVQDNTEIVFMPNKDLFEGMFWRFLPASDPNVQVMMSRDCDSRIGEREVAAVEEWLASDKDFHIMRDHPYHARAILGGMWGCRNRVIPEMSQLIDQWTSMDHKGCDQDFLGAIVYPRIRDQALEHSEFGHDYGGVTFPFPTERRDYGFVGEIFYPNDIRHENGWCRLRDRLEAEGAEAKSDAVPGE